jgi:hypothetical protein
MVAGLHARSQSTGRNEAQPKCFLARVPRAVRQPFVALRILVVVLLLVPALLAGEAENLAREAAKAARAGNYLQAFTLYSRAAQISPYGTYANQSRAMLAAAASQEQVRIGSTSASAAPQPSGSQDAVLAEDAALLGLVSPEALQETRRLLPPIRLEADRASHDLALSSPTQKLWEEVLKRYGLDVVFDDSVKDAEPVRLEIANAGYREAIRALELVSNTIAIPVGEKLLLVSANSANAQIQLEPTAAVAIPVPQAIANEDATEIANAIRQAMEIRTVMVDATRRILLLRDRYSKVLTAQVLAEELLSYPQDVVLDLEFREVTRRSFNRYGINLPTSFPITVFTNWMNNVARPAEGFTNFITFGGGASLVGIGIASAEAVAFMSRTDSKTIYRAEIRGNSGKETVFNLGQEYPILRSSFISGPTQQPGSSVFFPQVDFKQIGFAVKAKPVVWRNTVTLDLNVSVSLLTGESSNGIPVLANREATTRLQVENGQQIAVAGLLVKEEARSLTGLAGLNQLPGIGALFRQTSNTKDETEVLVVIRPRILQARSPRLASPVWWTGTSTRFVAPL